MNDLQEHRVIEDLKEVVASLDLRFPIKDIAEKTGYTKGNVSRYLNGKLIPSMNFILKFQESYNVKLKQTQTLANITNQNTDIMDDYAKEIINNLKEIIKEQKEFIKELKELNNKKK